MWIGRHTGEVLASNARMWRAMIEVYGLWDCPPGTLEGFLEDMVRAAAAVLARALEEMPPERMLWIDFAQLRARPRETLLEILEFVGPVSGTSGERDSATPGAKLEVTEVDRALARVPIHAGSRASLPADSDVLELERLMAAARQKFGSSKAL